MPKKKGMEPPAKLPPPKVAKKAVAKKKSKGGY